ncbi:PREDICTED: dynein assembly factor 3, axonemal homolog, partial [Papilio xuthus]
YDSSVASSNSLTSTSTTQTSTAKVTTTTVSGGNAVSNASAAGLGAAAGAGAGAGAGAAVYAGGALYGAAGAPTAYTYDDQLMRGALPHHMGGYYETGYVAREGTFGLGGGERFGRTDAASPQQ